MTDRFCVLGSVDEHIAKLHELAEAGVDQFNIYLMNGDEEAVLEVYGREIIPALRGVAAGRLTSGPVGCGRAPRTSPRRSGAVTCGAVRAGGPGLMD